MGLRSFFGMGGGRQVESVVPSAASRVTPLRPRRPKVDIKVSAIKNGRWRWGARQLGELVALSPMAGRTVGWEIPEHAVVAAQRAFGAENIGEDRDRPHGRLASRRSSNLKPINAL